MRHKLFTLAAGVSAVLCVAACVLWVRSYPHTERVRWWNSRLTTAWGAVSARGTATIWYLGERARPAEGPPRGFTGEVDAPTPSGYGYAYASAGMDASWSCGIVVYGWREGPSPMRKLCVPYWMTAVMFCLLPAAWIRQRVRLRRRIRDGCCIACGYDLRATPDRCPECGKVPAPTPSSF